MARLRIIGLLAVTALFCSVPALGGLWEDVYHGLDIVATPSGSPVHGVAGGGRANGARFGRLRIVPNEFGQGYRLELDRTFGADTRGRPETFDFGNFELRLSGATQTTLRYTTRGIPTANADVFANNLNYMLSGKSGGQDFNLVGTLSVNHQLEVNRLGCYSLELEINNSDSKLFADGLLVDGERDTDFDIGPIRIKGNVFCDAALAALTSLGVDTSGLEGVFPESPIDRINDEIQAALSEQALVLGDSVAAELAGGLEAQGLASNAIPMLDDSEAYGPAQTGLPVPESTSLLLLGALSLFIFRRRA